MLHNYFGVTPTTIADAVRLIPGVSAFIDRAQEATAAAEHCERLELHAAARRLEADDLAAIRKHEAERAPMLARVTDLEGQLRDAREALARREQSRRADSFSTSSALDRLRNRVAMLAPRADIESFTIEMQRMLADHRVLADTAADTDINGRLHILWSNGESIRRQSDAISAAIGAARALVHEPLDAAATRARLAELRATIPAIEPRPMRARQ